MYNRLLGIASISGLMAVVLGAFGTHALKPQISFEEMSMFEIANRYHFYHTLVLAAVAILFARDESPFLKISAYAFINGLVMFCGSLYIMSLRKFISADVTFMGPITPLGGIFLIIGWGMLAYYGFFLAKVQHFKKRSPRNDDV